MNQLTKQLSLLVTSDIHGYIFPTNYRDYVNRHLGLAKISTLVQKKREQLGNVLLLDNGDLIQGSPFTFFHAKYQSQSKNPMIKVANVMGYDASVLGNHEFNYGKSYLARVIEQSNFPWLSASILKQGDGIPAFGPPYMMKKVDGISVAILGVTTHYIPNWEETKHIEGLQFKDAFEAAKEWVHYIQLTEKPDLLIVSYHGGLERDIITGQPTEPLTGENQGYRMCQEIEGIDVLITGHQHRFIQTKLHNKAIIQPGHNGQGLGQVDIDFQLVDDKWVLTNCTPSIETIDEHVDADPKILQLVESDEQRTQNWLDRPIGEVIGDMFIQDAFEVRMNEHPFIEFINKVQMDRAKVDISCTALFDNAIPGFPAHLTMRDIVSNYIYPNTLKVIRISGKDIKDALEQSATYFILNDQGHITINPTYVSPKPQHYNYDMWEGIDYVLNITKPIGERVTMLTYQGKPIEYEREYEVVMNSYRASGGGNYFMFQGKPVTQDIPVDMTEIIADYMLMHKKVKALCNHNWRVVKE